MVQNTEKDRQKDRKVHIFIYKKIVKTHLFAIYKIKTKQ